MSDESHAPDERRVSSLAELSRSIEPARDLWPQIEAQIEAERAPRAGAAGAARRHAGQPRVLAWRALAAAAMVASVAVGVWIGRSVLPTTGSPATPSPLTASRGSPGQFDAPTVFDAAYVTDPRYQRQRAALIRGLEARLASLPPAAREKVMNSLTAIRRAKEDLESALGKDPSNALLQELLINTYQDEMRALTDLHQASEAGTGT